MVIENEKRLTIPPELMELYARSPQLVFKLHPIPGLWPIPPEWLLKPDVLKKLSAKEFQQKYEVVVIPR